MTVPFYEYLTLEPLRWWDIPDCVAIEEDLFPEDSPWNAAMFWSELAEGHVYLAAWDESELVGYAGLARNDEEAELRTIAVRADHQEHGIGRRLLTALIAAAEYRPITLEVRTDNDAAIILYRGFGFEQVGIRRDYYQPSGADAYVLRRNPVSATTSPNAPPAVEYDPEPKP
jgi:[ribosomal protein S18]-alanine N-acetyltransferase